MGNNAPSLMPMFDRENDRFNYYRQSLFKQFTNCPHKVFLEYVCGFVPEKKKPALVRGTAIHRAIEIVHEEKAWKDWLDVYDLSFKETLDAPEDAWKEWDVPEGSSLEEELELVKGEGETIFQAYAVQKHNQEAVVVLAESAFTFKTPGGHLVSGTIDQFRECKGGLMMVDFKSDKVEPSMIFLNNDIQFKTYYYATAYGTITSEGKKIDLPDKIAKMAWYQLRNNIPYQKAATKQGVKFKKGDERGSPFLFIEKKKPDLKTIEEDIDTLIRAINNKCFYRNPQSFGTCNMCAFQNACLGLPQKTQEDIMKFNMKKAEDSLEDLENE